MIHFYSIKHCLLISSPVLLVTKSIGNQFRFTINISYRVHAINEIVHTSMSIYMLLYVSTYVYMYIHCLTIDRYFKFDRLAIWLAVCWYLLRFRQSHVNYRKINRLFRNFVFDVFFCLLLFRIGFVFLAVFFMALNTIFIR